MPISDFGVGQVNEAADALEAMLRRAINERPQPQSMIVSPAAFEAISKSLPTQLRYSDTDLMKAGFNNILYAGVPMIVETPAIRTLMGGVLQEHYQPAVERAIFQENRLLPYLQEFGVTTQQKAEAPPMTVTAEIRAEINRDKEIKRVRKALARFEGSWLYKLETGAHIGFAVVFDDSGKPYEYGAVFDGKRWHLTGARSPQGIVTDDLVDWLIERKVSFKDVRLLVGSK